VNFPFICRNIPVARAYGVYSEASFRFFVEKPLYEIYLTRIKEQVDERRNTVGIHKNTDCLLKNSPQNIRNMLTLSIKNSEDVLVGSDFFFNLLLLLRTIKTLHCISTKPYHSNKQSKDTILTIHLYLVIYY
jgi:hypothetical protein